MVVLMYSALVLSYQKCSTDKLFIFSSEFICGKLPLTSDSGFKFRMHLVAVVYILGTIHNFQHFHKHTKHFFAYPLLPIRKHTFRKLLVNLFHVCLYAYT